MQAIQTPSRRWTGATQLTLGLTVERHRACEGFGGRFYFLPPCASTAPYPVLTCRVQVYLNHELKFGYVHLFKNGGSAILSNLNALLCKRQGKDPECGKQMKHVECLEPFNDCPDIKDYFTFTFSRNPYACPFPHPSLLARTLSQRVQLNELTSGTQMGPGGVDVELRAQEASESTELRRRSPQGREQLLLLARHAQPGLQIPSPEQREREAAQPGSAVA
eukprot:482101-Rhodomonas_salina.2